MKNHEVDFASDALLNPADLMASQLECEYINIPGGSYVFSRGSTADAIYALKRGIVELVDKHGNRSSFLPGELFSFAEIVFSDRTHQSDAIALTPVELLRLGRRSFLNLLHQHPTLALLLIKQQHDRLREQRSKSDIEYSNPSSSESILTKRKVKSSARTGNISRSAARSAIKAIKRNSQ